MKKLLFSGVILSAIVLLSACSKSKESTTLSIPYEKYTLPNGLQVILHVDQSDPVISYAVMYHVGSGREEKMKTGFAHLYEHLLFAGSENVPAGMFDKIIEGAGGSNNGFTSRDVTTYYEVFPKNALEKILWLESDRMGFFINSVTPRSLQIQQNVVQNEKRQRIDNTPYGFTSYVLYDNLYPDEHPYNWLVIGEMEDLKNATLDDAQSFYEKYYGPNNATIVLSGDFVIDSVKTLIEKYFGEIKSHGGITERPANVPKLEKTTKLYHEDNFANVPELTMVWPVPEAYHKDAYALDFLASVLADGKKTPMYKILIKEKQLTSEVAVYNYSSELSGEFTVNIRANEGKSLKEIETAIFESFKKFETEGITDRDIEQVKASTEKNFYQGLSGVFNKSLQLAFYNTLKNDPGYIQQDINNIKSVTREDVIRVYNTYIKDKPYVATSFVPKGQTDMIAEASVVAAVKEENIAEATQVSISEVANDSVVKSPSMIKRDVEPPLTEDPVVDIPEVWKGKLANGIQVYGIEQNELPLVYIQIVFDGGFYGDSLGLPGVANLLTDVMPQGTKNKTPEELEEEIKLLGANINMYTGKEEIVMTADMLSRNFEKTFSLMEEILLEPRWDSTEFNLAQTRTLNAILQNEAEPQAVARNTFYRVLYGDSHIFGFSTLGTKESVSNIQLEHLKNFYSKNLAPSVTKIHIVGNVTQERAMAAFKELEEKWSNTQVKTNSYPLPPSIDKSQIYFVDMPGSKQSVIYAGYLSMSRDNPDFVKADFVNYRLGGAFTSILNQTLREEKGYTYGAYSSFGEQKLVAPFVVGTSVRSDVTFESLRIIKESMENYRINITEEDLQFTKNYLLKSNALRFETLGSLAGMLTTMSKYGFEDDYIEKELEVIRNLPLDEDIAVAKKYIVPEKMVYLVVGDRATQMKPLEKLGFGSPVLLK